MVNVTKDLVVKSLAEVKEIADSEEFAAKHGYDHMVLIGLLKSLEAEGQVVNEPMKREGYKLTAEGQACCDLGSPEAQVFHWLKANAGKTAKDIEAALGATAKVGTGTALRNRWVEVGSDKCLGLLTDSITDTVQAELSSLATLSKNQLDALKKRKLVAPTSLTAFRTKVSEDFSADFKKDQAEITSEMIVKGTWKDEKFKSLNFKNTSGRPCTGGHLHPLNKVKTEIRNNLLLMGFDEMCTNQWVESSFWNFDSLFQPQQHPARDAHDTFFIGTPDRAQNIPAEYLQRVKEMHERGGQGSIGWRYDWSEDEARKNILRTHTTSVSARTLYKMGQDYQKTGVFTPKKCFSIDRVFRNETLDATHLAEFHQVEGFVADRNIGLGHLIGVLKDFFARVGISKLRFKPAYNPYTEPSMEIFGYHPQLKKWIEVGNSGVFRPEMLLPMGLPEDVSVIAWGIGCERWAALLYSIRNIKDLFSFQQDVQATKRNPVCHIRRAED